MQNSIPPNATKKAHEMTIHGDTRVDDYYWMRLTDEQKSAKEKDSHTQEVVDYIDAENDYTESRLKHTKKFQDKLFDEIVGRIKRMMNLSPIWIMDTFTIPAMKRVKSMPSIAGRKNL